MFKGTSFTLESFPHLLKLQKAFIALLIYLVTLAGHVSPSGAISALRCYSVRKIACFLSAGVRAEAGISPLCGKAVISNLAAGCALLSCKRVSVKVCSSNASSSRHGRRVRARKGSKLLPSTTASTSHGQAVTHTPSHTHTHTPGPPQARSAGPLLRPPSISWSNNHQSESSHVCLTCGMSFTSFQRSHACI